MPCQNKDFTLPLPLPLTRVDRMVSDTHNHEFVKQSQSSNYIEKGNPNN